jgi:pimeloyl-ACP methyl ester carboxylesterase
LPSSEVEKWAKELKTHSFGTKKAKSTAASWKEIPTWYLLCEDDKAIPKEAQEAMTQGVKDGGGEIEVTRIKSDHSPFLSHPEEVVKWIRKAAGEEL